jgi:hypothetical protein
MLPDFVQWDRKKPFCDIRFEGAAESGRSNTEWNHEPTLIILLHKKSPANGGAFITYKKTV